jgi:hypothetical protein
LGGEGEGEKEIRRDEVRYMEWEVVRKAKNTGEGKREATNVYRKLCCLSTHIVAAAGGGGGRS